MPNHQFYHPFFSPKNHVHMASPKHTIHVGIVFAGVLVAAVLSLFTGDPAVALMFSGVAMRAIGYWLGAQP
jgi:hypothetical protein